VTLARHQQIALEDWVTGQQQLAWMSCGPLTTNNDGHLSRALMQQLLAF
jgi:hypothetical protein